MLKNLTRIMIGLIFRCAAPKIIFNFARLQIMRHPVALFYMCKIIKSGCRALNSEGLDEIKCKMYGF
jgi:hypothetical protein